jgi:hypothetical protein
MYFLAEYLSVARYPPTDSQPPEGGLKNVSIRCKQIYTINEKLLNALLTHPPEQREGGWEGSERLNAY